MSDSPLLSLSDVLLNRRCPQQVSRIQCTKCDVASSSAQLSRVPTANLQIKRVCRPIDYEKHPTHDSREGGFLIKGEVQGLLARLTCFFDHYTGFCDGNCLFPILRGGGKVHLSKRVVYQSHRPTALPTAQSNARLHLLRIFGLL
jgi:hypothetical protein